MKIKIFSLLLLAILITACAAEPQHAQDTPTQTQPPPTATASPTRTNTPPPSATATATPENVFLPDKAFMIMFGTVAEVEYAEGISVDGAFFYGLWQFSQLTGSVEPFLPFDDLYNYMYPIWSPDGRRVAYLRVARTDEADTSIWVADLVSNERTMIVDEIPNEELHFYRGTNSLDLLGWSMDGQELYYKVRGYPITSVNLETKVIEEINVQIADYPEIEMQKWGFDRWYSEHAQKLLLSRCETENCDLIRYLIIDLLNLDDSILITSPEAWLSDDKLGDRRLRHAALSPDGKILLVTVVDDDGNIRIWNFDVDRQDWEVSIAIPSTLKPEDLEIYDTPHNAISWSGDGKWFAIWTGWYSEYMYTDNPPPNYLVTIDFVDTDSWEVKRQVEIRADLDPGPAGWIMDGNGNPVYAAKIKDEGLWLLKPDGSPENDLLWVELGVFEEGLPDQIAEVNIPVVRQHLYIDFQP